MSNKIFNSRILITGGAGFIGSHLVEELLKFEPAKIILIDNLIRGKIENIRSVINNPLVEFFEADITNEDLMDKLLFEVDFVFHMAALRINACAADPTHGFSAMMKATSTLANLCIKNKIKKIVYSSSASIYGLAQHFPTPETDHPYDNQTYYGAAKLWGEQLFRSFRFMYGMQYVALRYFNVYGPRMDTDGKYTEVMIRWLDCISDQQTPFIYGDGSDTMDFVFVKDVARANVAALLSDCSDETINVGTGVETSLNGLLEMLLEVNHSHLKVKYKRQNSVNPVSRRLASTKKAAELLDFRTSVTLESGLKELSRWYFSTKKRTPHLL